MKLSEVDTLCVGTGVAALVAAIELQRAGEQVALINPDRDFFLESLELPIHPEWLLPDPTLWAQAARIETLDSLRSILEPYYPGSIEIWPKSTSSFHDPTAPHLRQRPHVLLWDSDEDPLRIAWKQVSLQETPIKQQAISGTQAAVRIPGRAGKLQSSAFSGDLLINGADWDVRCYQQGILEYALEQIPSTHLFRNVHHLRTENFPSVVVEGPGYGFSLKVKKQILVFKSPSTDRCLSIRSPQPYQNINEWQLISRDPITIDTQVHWKQSLLMARFEGRPTTEGVRSLTLWSSESNPLQPLSHMVSERLGWNRLSVRSLTRYTWLPQCKTSTPLTKEQKVHPLIKTITHASGGLPRVLRGDP